MEFVELTSALLEKTKTADYPRTEKVIGIINKLRIAVFPGLLCEASDSQPQETQLLRLVENLHEELTHEIELSLLAQKGEKADVSSAADISKGLLDSLKDIQQVLYKDAQAGYDGDPAARSVDEVILTYPGFFAVFVHRIAHSLFTAGVPFIPRMMSEHAHSVTGVDIHPGAQIGECFFIDHGTGVVIGETAVIGNRVKLYQGVTIGALSVKKRKGCESIKRHPTIEDNVTVYSGASILGGETVIGEGAVIGGNAFIVKSVPAGRVVKAHNPELQYDSGGSITSREFSQPDVWFYEI